MEKQNSKKTVKNSKPLSEKEQEKTAFSYKGFMSSDVKQAAEEAYEELRKMAYDVKTNTYKSIALYELEDLFKDKFGFELE